MAQRPISATAIAPPMNTASRSAKAPRSSGTAAPATRSASKGEIAGASTVVMTVAESSSDGSMPRIAATAGPDRIGGAAPMMASPSTMPGSSDGRPTMASAVPISTAGPKVQPQAGDREPLRPAQDAADDHEVGAREGERDEGEDAEAEQRPRRRGGARQRKADKDADDEPLRAVAADEVEEIEDAAAEAVHDPPPEPRRRGGVNADASGRAARAGARAVAVASTRSPGRRAAGPRWGSSRRASLRHAG